MAFCLIFVGKFQVGEKAGSGGSVQEDFGKVLCSIGCSGCCVTIMFKSSRYW